MVSSQLPFMDSALKRLLTVLMLTCFAAGSSVAQNRETEFKEVYPTASKHFDNEDFTQALSYLLGLHKLSPRNANINYLIGRSYLNIPGQKEKAVPYLEVAASSTSEKYRDNYKETNAPLDAFFYLGRAYHLNLDFDKAVTAYRQYLSKGNVWDEEEKIAVKRMVQNCQNAKLIIESPMSVELVPIGKSINSPYDEYAAVVDSAETMLIFTSRRPITSDARMDLDGKYFENIYIAYKDSAGEWGVPQSIGPQINTEWHDASISISADGEELYIYRDDVGVGNIYVSRRKGNSWGEPVKLNDNINSPFRETHASISSDGQTLYFTSDRSGFGGMDIFVSRRLPNGEWGVAENIGRRINTPYDEEAPFIHPDGKTLFFSSKGHNSMGGYDIFFSVMQDDGKWSSPFNLGFPINTPDDDYFFVMSADGKRAYYSSATVDGKGGKDIYMALLDTDREEPVTVYKGAIVEDESGAMPMDVSITVSNLSNGELVGVYRPRPDNGRFVFILQPGQSYQVTYESSGYEVSTEVLHVPSQTAYREVNRAMSLTPAVMRPE